MIAYVFWKNSLSINAKILNVKSINGTEIIGEDANGLSSEIRFGDGSDYIILQSDTINKNIGDVIDLAEIEDERDYFLKGKDIWFQEKVNKLNNTNNQLNDRLKTLETIPNLPTRVTSSEEDINVSEDTLNSILVDILPKLMA